MLCARNYEEISEYVVRKTEWKGGEVRGARGRGSAGSLR